MIYTYGLFVEETKRHLNMATKFVTLFEYIYQRIMRNLRFLAALILKFSRQGTCLL